MASENTSSFLPPEADTSAFPVTVVQALQTVASEAAPVTLEAQTALQVDKPSPRIALPQAMAMILEALDSFDTRLGEAARNVFNQSDRMNIHEVPEGKGVMMRVRAANLQEKDAMSIEEHPDIERLRKNFPFDHNKGNEVSVIDFEYDGGINSVIYLAHELGHAIADDYQQRHGGYSQNPKHMEETQAYLVQAIVTAHMQENPDPDIAAAAKRQFADEMAGQVYAYPLAGIAATAMEMMEKGETVQPAALYQAGFGDNWQNVAEKNYHGEKLFAALEAVNTAQLEGRSPDKGTVKTLTDATERLHDRPTNQLVAVGIAASLQGQEQETKSKISEMVLGLYGPKSIGDVLDEAGVTGDKMKGFMEKTIKAATAPLQETEAKPSAHLQSRPRATANASP